MRRILLPFSPPPFPLSFEIDFNIINDHLMISYILDGSLENISMIDQPVLPLQRKQELWTNTCFEWFVRSESIQKYWEFNASPKGEWNFYELESYRKNLTESKLIENPKIFQSSPYMGFGTGKFICLMEHSLKELYLQNPSLMENSQFAVTSVIRWKSGEISYYSMNHRMDKPDFHSKDGFILSPKKWEH